MMNTMIEEKGVTFKTLEQEIFRFFCDLAKDFTAEILEKYDAYLHDTRDRSVLRDKGTRRTTTKTVYGEVAFSRHVYKTCDQYGANHCIYLLDENLKLERIGLISENCVEMMVSSITEMPYRNCADGTTEMTGLPTSHTGVWNVIQSLGEKLEEDEKALTEAIHSGLVKGKREAPVLFEEADGVWLNLQGKDRKRRHFPKAEMKAAIAYDGWKPEGQGRFSLDGKVVTAGFEKASEFQKKREDMIAAEYNLDETQIHYLEVNREGLLLYQKRNLKIPESSKGPVYKNMGTMENHIWSIIARRMKHKFPSAYFSEIGAY